MKKICDDHDPIIVTRRNNEALNETSFLLQSPKNAKRLIDSIVELNAGKG